MDGFNQRGEGGFTNNERALDALLIFTGECKCGGLNEGWRAVRGAVLSHQPQVGHLVGHEWDKVGRWKPLCVKGLMLSFLSLSHLSHLSHQIRIGTPFDVYGVRRPWTTDLSTVRSMAGQPEAGRKRGKPEASS